MLLWKALLWKRYPAGNPALAQGRLKWKALLWERDLLGALNRALGSQRSSLEEESTPPPQMEPTTKEAEKKVRKGVWGDTTTTLLPDAFE